MCETQRNVIIIGSGPAGLTAAVYLARAQLKPVVFEGIEPGGQLTTAAAIENYPGFAEGIAGPELMELFRKQAERFGAEINPGQVTKIDFLEDPMKVRAEHQVHLTHAVIVATGASYKWLGLKSEQELRGYGVSACATCDGFFHRDRPVAVVGGGDTAMEEVLFLARIASKVTVIHRRNRFRASRIMADRVMSHPKVEIKWNSVVEEVVGEKGSAGVSAVRIKDLDSGAPAIIPCSGVFVAIGRKPNSDLFRGVLPLDLNGYVMTRSGSTCTDVEGVFACGDVQDNTYRQAVTAAGSGAMAAMDAERWLEKHRLC